MGRTHSEPVKRLLQLHSRRGQIVKVDKDIADLIYMIEWHQTRLIKFYRTLDARLNEKRDRLSALSLEVKQLLYNQHFQNGKD